MKDIMLDIETLGKRPGCAILSIGAATLDLTSKFYVNIDSKTCLQLGMHTETETVQWWRDQSDEAKASLTSNRLCVRSAINEFEKWFVGVKGEKVWCQGAAFDIPILEAAFRTVGVDVPWKFWNVRDTRTAYDVFNFNPKSIQRDGTYHNALDDSIHQIKCLEEAFKNGQTQ